MPGPRKGKSSTPTKAVAKVKGQRYNYTELAKVKLSEDERINFYGVIIDATFPYKVADGAGDSKYIVSLKVIDPSLHSKGGKPSDNDYATVVLFALKFEDLPIVGRVGDIIRVHRASLRMH